jgi:hypothetical protein
LRSNEAGKYSFKFPLTSPKGSDIITELSEKFRENDGNKRKPSELVKKRTKQVLTNSSGFDRISNATVKN